MANQLRHEHYRFWPVFAYGAAAISLGIALYLGFPQSPLAFIGASFCIIGVMYWIWVVLSLPSGKAEIPPMLRFLFSVIAACALLGILAPYLSWSRAPIVLVIQPPAPPSTIPTVSPMAPAPPVMPRTRHDLARVLFSFDTLDPKLFPVKETSVRLINGIAEVRIIARAEGNISAKDGWLTIMICNACRYAEEPPNTTIPADRVLAIIARQRKFETIYAGTVSEPINLRIIPPASPFDGWFHIAGRYVCDNCPADDPTKQQLLKVITQ